MPNFPFTVGDSLRIGSATILASGNAVVLPTGTQVGNQNVATTVEVSTGGGPKITNLQVTSNVYVVLDDTAVDLTGGFIKITGTNFVSGCMVYVASTPANSTTFVSTTEVRAQLPATAAGTYPVYLVNPDGGTAIRVPGVTFSASPAWQTASSLGEQYDGVVLTLPVVATDATVYTLTSGSLPPGLSLNSNTGVISGTVSGVANDTVYSFTITATDAQLQDSPRTFTVTITVSDPYFKLTTLLLSGSAVSANTVVRDSSTNNFNLTVFGDSRASNFTPYGTGWSVQFDGNGDYLSISTNAALNLSSGDFTIEGWAYWTGSNSGGTILNKDGVSGTSFPSYLLSLNGSGYFRGVVGSGNGTGYIQTITSSVLAPINQWVHLAFVKNGTTLTLYQNGTNVGSATQTGTIVDGAKAVLIGYETGQGSTTYWSGYISNTRIVKDTALYTANFTPATTNLTSVANTSLLTCHANRFLDGSTNNFAITRNGDARVVSFNPFNITNTGVNGSMYFDGTDDYVTVGTTASNAFAFSGDFTIEAWFYKPGNGSDTYEILLSIGDGNGINGFFLELDDTRSLAPRLYMNNGALVLDGYLSSKINDAQWHHIACVRSGSNCAMFYDGTRVATSTSSASLVSSASALHIGRLASGSTNDFYGYVSDVRIINGTAAYNPTLTTLTVPTSPVTAIANTQLLTLQYDQPHNNHTFLDSSSNQFLITRNGNASQGTFSPFSQTGWGNFLDGSTAYFTVAANSAINDFGTGDFNMELWFYATSSNFAAEPSLLSCGVTWATSVAYQFEIRTGGIVYFFGGDSVPININSGATTVSVNTWNHVAASRASGTTRLFVNGTQVSSTNTVATISKSSTAVIIGAFFNAAQKFTGYLSNVRIVKGQALYTGNFTPPTAALTTTSVGTSGTNVATSVTGTVGLLTCQSNRFIDNSTNNFTITRNGSPSVQAFSPFAPTAVYSPVTHGGSGYFDGTGDWLTVGTASNWAFLNYFNVDFTVSFWLFHPSASTAYGILCTGWNSTEVGFNIVVNNSANNVISTFFSRGVSGSQASFDSSANLVQNSWNYVTITYTTSTKTVAFYINGASAGSGSNTGFAYSSSNPAFTLNVGRSIGGVAGSINNLNGYLADLRILNGSIGSTTVPTAPVTATTNTSLLLNFTDAAILDSTGRNVLETVADAKSTNVVTKFTGGSMSFDGTGDYLFEPHSTLYEFGSGDFTIEFWARANSLSGAYTGVVGVWFAGSTVTANSWYVSLNAYNATNKFGFSYTQSSTSYELVFNAPTSTGSWDHYAIVRSGGTLYGFKNGVSQTLSSGSSTISGAINNGTNGLYVGTTGTDGGGTAFNGYIQDLRITKGYARYTANFTAPTVPARLK